MNLYGTYTIGYERIIHGGFGANGNSVPLSRKSIRMQVYRRFTNGGVALHMELLAIVTHISLLDSTSCFYKKTSSFVGLESIGHCKQ